MRRFDTVLFDLDGTLLDTLEDICGAANHTLRELGYPERTLAEMRRFVGNGAEMQMRRSLGADADEETVAKALTLYKPYYAAHCQIKTKPYAGVLELMAALKAEGFRLAVVSNKPDEAVRPLVAQHFGARDTQRVRRSICTAMLLSVVCGILLTVLGITSARQLLVWMQTTPETLDASASYLRIFFLGMVPTMLYNMGSGILRAMGDSKRPLYYLFVCVVANIALDLLFVIVFQWGIEGAAAATALSQVVCAALVVRALRRLPEEQRLLYDREELDRGILRRMLHVGIPAALQSSMYGIANIVLQVGINMLGTDSMAGWTAFNKFDDYYWPISNAIGIAVMTYVGQNFGAGDRERVHESIHKGLLIHLTTSALFSVIIFSGRYPMMHLFVGDDPTVIAIGAQVTALIAPCYVLFTLVEVLSSTMRGVGDAVVPAAITMVFTCIVRLIYLWGYAFSHNSNLTIAVIYPISWVLTSIAFLLYYKSRKWMPKGFHF